MQLQENEKIKFVRGYEEFYSITTLGRVWSNRYSRWLKPWISSKGYEQVTLMVDGKVANPTVHKLVADAFIPNPQNKPQINHKNGNKKDSRVSNLEWVTSRENLQHACDMGLNSHYKLSLKDKLLICQIFDSVKITKTKLAEMFGLSTAGICYVINTYKPLTGNA
jgi:hypothetical protein